MRIVMGADQYPEYINGAATFTARLASGLAAAGHAVDLLWPSASGGHDVHLGAGVRVHRLTSIRLPGRPRMHVCDPRTSRGEVARILQATCPDVVHVQSHLALGRRLLREARAAGVPVLATNHFMPENLIHHVPLVRHFPQTVTRLAWRDLERVYSGADLVSVPTERAADLLARSTGLEPAHVVSCGIDLDRFCPQRPLRRSGGPRVLFVGRLEQEKHLDELVRAFARLPPALGARLEIIGMGSLRLSLETLARTLQVDSSVAFLGAVPDEELLAAYHRADLFAMPGTAELQSIATLEAMATGLPVLAADAMALPHLVRPDRNGRLYRPGDVDDLTSALTQLLGDPALCTRLGLASRAMAEAHALSATLESFEDHYSRIVQSRLSLRRSQRELATAS